MSGGDKIKGKMNKYFLSVIFVVGFIWLRSGLGKLTGGFAGTLDKALIKFASENPYSFIKDFLNSIVLPNHAIFSYLTMWGEIFAGASLIICSIAIAADNKINKVFFRVLALGLLVGVFLNLTFWFSAGWMSPSTDGLNLLMFSIEIAALFAAISKLKSS